MIQTGLIIGTGSALANSGPGSILISYSIVGLLCYAVMCALGEMVSEEGLLGGLCGALVILDGPSLPPRHYFIEASRAYANALDHPQATWLPAAGGFAPYATRVSPTTV